MSSNIYYSNCPCCNSENIQEVFKVKDFTVSMQVFAVWHCNNCTLRFTQNVPNEHSIAPFYKAESYISHTDSKKGIINQLYHTVRNYTLTTKSKLIIKQTNLQKGNLLDVGAGTGAFCQTMQQKNWNIIGLEPDADAREVAFKKYSLQLQQTENLFKLPANNFDAITMWHVLEHVHSLHNYLKQFNLLLKEKGKLFIAVPNYTSKDAKHYQQFWAAYDVPRHLYHFSPKSIEILAQQYGFKVAAIKPMWFDSFYVSMLSEQYKNNGKGNMPKAFFHGLLSNLNTLKSKSECSSVIYILEKQ